MCSQKINDPRDVTVRDIGALHAGWLRVSLRIVKHIAPSKQFLRAVHVKNRAAVHPTRDRQGNSRRHIGLDLSGHNIDGWALRRDDQMNARRPGQLRQAADRVLNVLGRNHHEVGQLVNDDDDSRHLF